MTSQPNPIPNPVSQPGPRGWLKLFLLLAITGGTLIALFSVRVLLNGSVFGVGLLCCGLMMIMLGCKSWSCYKKGLSEALAFSRGCVGVFFLLTLYIIGYGIADAVIYGKDIQFGFFGMVLVLSSLWCCVWLWYLSVSKQVKRLLHFLPQGRWNVKIVLLVLGFVLAGCFAGFYIQEQNIHYTREMRYITDQLQAARERLAEEDDREDDEMESAGGYLENENQEASATNDIQSPKVKTEERKSNEAIGASNSGRGSKRIDVGVATLQVPASYNCDYDNDGNSYQIENEQNLIFFYPRMIIVDEDLLSRYKNALDFAVLVGIGPAAENCDKIEDEIRKYMRSPSKRGLGSDRYEHEGNEIVYVSVALVMNGENIDATVYWITRGSKVASFITFPKATPEIKRIVESLEFK